MMKKRVIESPRPKSSPHVIDRLSLFAESETPQDLLEYVPYRRKKSTKRMSVTPEEFKAEIQAGFLLLEEAKKCFKERPIPIPPRKRTKVAPRASCVSNHTSTEMLMLTGGQPLSRRKSYSALLQSVKPILILKPHNHPYHNTRKVHFTPLKGENAPTNFHVFDPTESITNYNKKLIEKREIEFFKRLDMVPNRRIIEKQINSYENSPQILESIGIKAEKKRITLSPKPKKLKSKSPTPKKKIDVDFDIEPSKKRNFSPSPRKNSTKNKPVKNPYFTNAKNSSFIIYQSPVVCD